MKLRLSGSLRVFVYGALAVLALCGQSARGTTLTANLTCALSNTTCDPFSLSQGTVTLDDSTFGQITLTVDLVFGGKFRDLMLNFNGAGISSVSSSDGQASLSNNGFSFPPYNGLFDIGGTGGQHWHGDNHYTTTLSSVDGSLLLGMFDVRDSLNNVNVSVHIQNIPGVGSLKVGGIWEGGGGPGQEIPEPATATLLGGGLLILAWALRRRKAS
jgi:hypothetical protein